MISLNKAKIELNPSKAAYPLPENLMHGSHRVITVARLVLSVYASIVMIVYTTGASFAADAPTKINFKSEAFSTEFDMLGDKQHGTIVNGAGQTETKLTVSADGMSVKIEAGTTVIGFLNLKHPDEIKLEDDHKKEMFILKKEPDGHYKLKTAGGDTIYKLKVETYGLKMEDGQQQPIYKVHVHDDKMSLKNIAGKEILSTKAKLPPIALACFAFDVLRQPQRAACAFALTYLRN